MKQQKHVSRALRQMMLVALFAFCLVMLPACGQDEAGDVAEALGSIGGPDGGEATGAAFAQPADVVEAIPSAGGIDTSNVSAGYVSASASSASRLKFQVINGDMTYNYDLPGDGTPIVCPINMGDGAYTFRVMQNTEGNNYVEIDSAGADVALANEFSPFLTPNIFCDYTAGSACVKKAREITKDSTNEGEAVRDVCTFVAGHVSYDNDKAAKLSTATGYVPSPDDTLATGTGICFDYAALSAAMLRSLGLPAKVVTGYVTKDQIYHAWIMVYVEGTWQSALFQVNPKTWSRCDVTFASSGSSAYVGDGSAYTDKYTY